MSLHLYIQTLASQTAPPPAARSKRTATPYVTRLGRTIHWVKRLFKTTYIWLSSSLWHDWSVTCLLLTFWTFLLSSLDNSIIFGCVTFIYFCMHFIRFVHLISTQQSISAVPSLSFYSRPFHIELCLEVSIAVTVMGTSLPHMRRDNFQLVSFWLLVAIQHKLRLSNEANRRRYLLQQWPDATHGLVCHVLFRMTTKPKKTLVFPRWI